MEKYLNSINTNHPQFDTISTHLKRFSSVNFRLTTQTSLNLPLKMLYFSFNLTNKTIDGN